MRSLNGPTFRFICCERITANKSFINRSNLFVFKVGATKIKIKVETYRKF